MTSESPTPPPRGRKPLEDRDAVMVPVAIRLTPAQRDKLKQIGHQRLRDWLDRAKV